MAEHGTGSDPFDRVVDQERARHRRRRWQRARAALRIHVVVYLAVNAGLVAVWLVTTLLGAPDRPWFLASVIGWGTGLAVHALAVHRPGRRPQPRT
jgi:hypothetical protein